MTPAQDLLTRSALTAFKLNGQFLAVADRLASPTGLTAARWQVLGAVLSQPRSVAEIARQMGITRQSVQRTADRLVEDDLARYQPNPAHRRAKLLAPTEAGLAAVKRIDPTHAEFAHQLAARLGDGFPAIVSALETLTAALDDLEPNPAL